MYTNGVFHSQFNPARPLGGGLWDLLSVPALLLPQMKSQRVLLLGVGGGAVINQLRVLLDSPDIIGIDLDAVHLRIAKRWFGVKGRGTTLIHADARMWLKQYKGRKFDLIIDDLFVESDGEPFRAVPIDIGWAALLRKVVKPTGLIVANYLDRRELLDSALTLPDSALTLPDSALTQGGGGKSTYRFEHPVYQNSIGVHGCTVQLLQQLPVRLHQHPQLNAEQIRAALNIDMTRVTVR